MMRSVANTTYIRKTVGNDSFECVVTLGPCPFCLGYEIHVSDVALAADDSRNPRESVKCGECGATGPWGGDELEAVQKWNAACGVRTELRTEWSKLQCGMYSYADPATPF